MTTEKSLIFTNSNCIGCNRCISVCSSNGACMSVEENNIHRIKVDPHRCVGCGACLDVCEHHAREYRDDTSRFFRDLAAGKSISVLIAPAFKANYPERYEKLLGYIKKCGAKHFINVSFGADITTWGYLNYIQKTNVKGGISQPCPAVVGYIERHLPELIGNIIPVQSPLMCAAIYARKHMGITDSLAFISPCIAKKMEISDPVNKNLVSYNVTFKHLIEYIDKHPLEAEPCRDELESGLGSAYPMPGGLKENIRWFLGESAFIRQMDGEKRMYRYLEQNRDIFTKGLAPFILVDALNCSNGCIYGTGCESSKSENDFVLFNEMEIKESSKTVETADAWSSALSPAERLELLNKQFENLDLNDFIRTYTDLSASCNYHIPSEEERDEIFKSMRKFTDKERKINCSCCGYDSCTQMVDAIYNGFNCRENCVNYLRYEVIEKATQAAAVEAVSEAKSVFLANISHEIRTPLNGVLGMNSIILNESKEASTLQYAQDIDKAGHSLLSIINDILDLSKIEAGKIEICTSKYSYLSLIKDCYVINSHIASEKGLKFNVVFEKPIPCNLYGDETRVRQILMNLISNAIKYTEKGSITLTLSWEQRTGNNILVKMVVADTGQGVRPEDLPDLFESFKRVNIKKNRSIQGTGLGLPISKQLAQMMGGDITVTSKYGHGSAFTVEIIQQMKDNATAADLNDNVNDYVRKKSGSFMAPNARLLVVDDTTVNLQVIKGLLRNTQMQIDLADSGRKALEFTAANKYDLILMDHMMPEMDGIETLNALKNQKDGQNLDTPVIVQTANAMRGASDEYLSLGFNDYLSKPIIPAMLTEKIQKYIKCQYKD